MKFPPHYTSKFRKDFKACMKRGLSMSFLRSVMESLREGKQLPPECKDHPLKGNFSCFRECHIMGKKSDWVLVYRYDGAGRIIFARTGTHSEILKR